MMDSIYDILFLDIETVPEKESFQMLSDIEKELWEEKTKWQRKDEIKAEDFYKNAAILAEFGKIICIGVGYFKKTSQGRIFRTRAIYSHREKEILEEFSQMLNMHYNTPQKRLCGHNAKEFDFPYICRRLLINNMPIPQILNLSGKKPWQVPHYDTMDMWRFGDYKHYVSIKLLTHILGVPTPKDDIDGGDIAEVYYRENNLEKIATYCIKDTVALARVFLRFTQQQQLQDKDIVVVETRKNMKNTTQTD